MHAFFYLVDATACRSPHHRMALDALLHLNCRHAKRWQRVFLRYYQDYLEGAKAPDTKFRDFRNHVLHVRQNNWGGAPETAQEWYHHTVEAIEMQAWRNVAYSAGVLSHYLTDIVHPFHTGQSTAETNIHRAFEWSTSKAYRRICPLYQTERDQTNFQLGDGQFWLRDSMIENARYANQVYENLISQYDFKISAVRPVGAMNDYCLKTMAKLIRRATHFYAQVLSRALDEIDVLPPLVHLHTESLVAIGKAPYRWARSAARNSKVRYDVFQMIDEYERTGQVLNFLPEENRTIKSLVAEPSYGAPASDEAIEPTNRDYRRRPPLPSSQPKELNELSDARTASQSWDSLDDSTALPQRDSSLGKTKRSASVDSPTRANKTKSDSASVRPTLSLETRQRPSKQERLQRRVKRSNLPVDREAATQHKSSSEKPNHASLHAPNSMRAAVTDLDPRTSAAVSSSSSNRRFFLGLEASVEEGPSIGPKTAKRLARIGVHTVQDLVEGDAHRIAAELNNGWIDEHTVGDWQDQARLVCCIPELRGHDAQLLVGCDLRRPSDISTANPTSLLSQVTKYANSAEGQRILRSGKRPDLAEIESWIHNANHARPIREALRPTPTNTIRAAA